MTTEMRKEYLEELESEIVAKIAKYNYFADSVGYMPVHLYRHENDEKMEVVPNTEQKSLVGRSFMTSKTAKAVLEAAGFKHVSDYYADSEWVNGTESLTLKYGNGEYHIE